MTLFILWICFLLIICPAHSEPNKSSNSTTILSSSACLPLFHTNRAHFDPCRTQVCFLFIAQEPYVILDSSMKTDQESTLFPCKNKKLLYPNLDGISFQIHSEIDFDSLCVWGGPHCTFNTMFDFLNDISMNPATQAYQFGLTGMVALLPQRMTTHTRPTITISEAPVILLKSTIGLGPESLSDSFEQVSRGFGTGSWALIFSFLGGLLFLAYVISFRFTGSSSLFAFMGRLLVQENRKRSDIYGESEHVRRTKYNMYITSMKLIGVMFGMFVMVVALFYEVSVVNFLFSPAEEKLGKPLSTFSDAELSKFSAQSGSIKHQSLQKAVDPDGKRYPNQKYPWHQCIVEEECYKRLLDPDDNVNIIAVFQPNARYMVKKSMVCNHITTISTEKPILVSSFGWYLGSTVPNEKHRKLNQQLMMLKIAGQIELMIDRETGKSDINCGKQKLSIRPAYIWIPIAILLGPILLVIFIMIVASLVITSQTKEHDSQSPPNINKME